MTSVAFLRALSEIRLKFFMDETYCIIRRTLIPGELAEHRIFVVCTLAFLLPEAILNVIDIPPCCSSPG